MSRGEGRNTPEQMGREKQDWKRNSELLTILNPSRGSKNHWNCCGTIHERLHVNSLNAKTEEGLGFNAEGISLP